MIPMSVIFRPLLAFILLALSACGGTSGGATAVYGNYEGVIPCADCPGIKTELFLSQDGLFRLSETYLSRSTQPIVTTGQWMRDDQGLIRLKGGSGDRFFAVADSQTLRMYDRDGKPIADTELDYELRRVGDAVR
jgi:copper homeostasis protein (lipoprotein)